MPALMELTFQREGGRKSWRGGGKREREGELVIMSDGDKY